MKKLIKKFIGGGESGKFGWVSGVFTPDVLTILGVIMFLRLGWVVGNAGVMGAIAIILLAKVITICTGLSMSSITTNIRIGAGGAYSIIAKSLGLEAAGSIGIPFYTSQSLSAALYIVGFTEGWLMIFPGHDPLYVAIATWAVTFGISYFSTAFALKIQFFILAIILLSILSFVFSPTDPTPNMQLIGTFEDAGFWGVFAVFFPAVTGIMAGANLSGDLKDPRKAIPLGTLTAIILTMIIYVGLAYFSGYFISPGELRENQMIMVDYALIGPIVVGGILAATFSSALGSIVGAPRILQAISEHKTIPMSGFFAKKTDKNEPRNANIFTALMILVFVVLFFKDLNALATLITMFFLITYGMLNFVVYIQQSLKIISFRPTFKIPRFVSFIGAVGCIFVMFLINPVFSFVAILVIIGLYVWLTKKGLEGEGDLRGGMYLALAEVAAKMSEQFPRHQITWKPDLLVPIEHPQEWGSSLLFINNMTFPSGSIFALTVNDTDTEKTKHSLDEVLYPMRERGLRVKSAVINDSDFLHGIRIVMQTLQAGAMRPNTLFLRLGDNKEKDEVMKTLIGYADQHELGTVILRQHPRTAFGMQKDLNLWLRDQSPNWHLAMLLSLQLQMNWQGKINFITAAPPGTGTKRFYKFFENLNDHARLPSVSEFYVLEGAFPGVIADAPRADINIFGLGNTIPFDTIRKMPEYTKSSCVFVKDSGKENALV